MFDYKLIAESNHFIVLDRYPQVGKVAESYQGGDVLDHFDKERLGNFKGSRGQGKQTVKFLLEHLIKHYGYWQSNDIKEDQRA